jgi:hypothetical protein
VKEGRYFLSSSLSLRKVTPVEVIFETNFDQISPIMMKNRIRKTTKRKLLKKLKNNDLFSFLFFILKCSNLILVTSIPLTFNFTDVFFTQ